METEGNKMFNYKEAEAKKKKFLRYKEGSEIYSMGITKFQEIAKLAGAVYKIIQMVLVKERTTYFQLIMELISKAT